MPLLQFMSDNPRLTVTVLLIVCVTLVCVIDLLVNRQQVRVPSCSPAPPPRPPK